jgi:hypothetical protein
MKGAPSMSNAEFNMHSKEAKSAKTPNQRKTYGLLSEYLAKYEQIKKLQSHI